MSTTINEQINAFLERMAGDDDFRARFEGESDHAEIERRLREAGYDFSVADLKAAATDGAPTGALEDAQLAQVAGGGWGDVGRAVLNVAKEVGDSALIVNLSGVTDWAAKHTANGIKGTARFIKGLF